MPTAPCVHSHTEQFLHAIRRGINRLKEELWLPLAGPFRSVKGNECMGVNSFIEWNEAQVPCPSGGVGGLGERTINHFTTAEPSVAYKRKKLLPDFKLKFYLHITSIGNKMRK